MAKEVSAQIKLQIPAGKATRLLPSALPWVSTA